MFTHTPQSKPKAWSNANSDPRQFSEIYFSYSSNMSPDTMRGRHPESMFCGLAKLKNWRWTISSARYANIVPSTQDGEHEVYGSLYFISPRDEMALDESEGVPHHCQKEWLEVTRINADGSEVDQKVTALLYVDRQRPDEGEIMPDYNVWIHKAVRDAAPFGLPNDYVEKYIRPHLTSTSTNDEDRDMQPVRMLFSKNQLQ